MNGAAGTRTGSRRRAWIVGGVAVLLAAAGIAGVMLNRADASGQASEGDYWTDPPKSKKSVPFTYRQRLIEDVPVALSTMSSAKRVVVRSGAGDQLIIRGRSGLSKPFFGESVSGEFVGGLQFGYDGSDPAVPLDDGRNGVPTTMELPAYPVWMFQLVAHNAEIDADFRGLEVRFIALQSNGDVNITLPDRLLKREGQEDWPTSEMSRRNSTTVGIVISAPSTSTVFIRVPPDSAVAVINEQRKPRPDAKKAVDPLAGNVWLVGDWEKASHTYSIMIEASNADDDTKGLEPKLVLQETEE